jgi:hypothetical protein
MMRPLFETSGAALLIGAAVFLLLFGPDGAVMLVYHAFPVDQRMWLFDAFPPSRVHIDLPFQALAALVVLLAGALQAIGVWVVYYECRKALVGMSLGAAVAVVWMFWRV